MELTGTIGVTAAAIVVTVVIVAVVVGCDMQVDNTLEYRRCCCCWQHQEKKRRKAQVDEPAELIEIAEVAVRKLAKVEEWTGEKTLKMDDHKVCRVPPATVSDSVGAETSTFSINFVILYSVLCTFFSETLKL